MNDFLQMEIEENGDLTYASYMEYTLYHPTLGYYNKEKPKIGTSGDFYTTSYVSGIYAEKIAQLFYRLVQDGYLAPIVCELGGGTGRFATAFIQEWKKLCGPPLTYYIVESSPYHKALQKELLGEEVKQFTSIDEIGSSFQGFIFSNEFFDAFPVHVIEKKDTKLYEVMISMTEERKLVEVCLPLQNEKIVQYLADHTLELNEGQRFEVPLAMSTYIEKLAHWFTKGIMLTVDYGYTFEEWMSPYHKDGSLRGYYNHTLIPNALSHPGEMDLTTHIHLDSLIKEGEQNGLIHLWNGNQREFLLATGILADLQQHTDPNPFSTQSKKNRGIRSLIMSEGISSYFQVVIQEKGINIPLDLYLQKV